MCCCDSAASRQARQQRLQTKYERELKRYGVSPMTAPGTTSSEVTVPSGPESGVAPPAYSSIDGSSGPKDLPPAILRSAHTAAPTGQADIPVLHVKVPKVPIMNDPYQNPWLYSGGPKATSESCQRGQHDGKRVFGVGGLVGGVLFFPFGLFWTKCDSRLVCRNCGLVMLGPHQIPHSDLEKAQPQLQPVHAVQPKMERPAEVKSNTVIKVQ